MRLQDLRDDLAHAESETGWLKAAGPLVIVARRLAALYDTCAGCGGNGYFTPGGEYEGDERVPCSRCGGTGMVASALWGRQAIEGGLAAGPKPPTPLAGAHTLARYLFGEETP
jgi:hypothetical protein